jgi:hypothetical protein
MRHRTAFLLVASASLVALGAYLLLDHSGASAQSPSQDYVRCMAVVPHATGDKLERREEECEQREAVINRLTPAQRADERRQLDAQFEAQSRHAAQQAPTEGIVESRGGPPGASQIFRTINEWDGEINGRWYVVYAGATLDPETNRAVQAELRIYREPAGLGASETEKLAFVGIYVPPGSGSEPLRITAATGSTLTVATSAGTTVDLDVADSIAAH